MIDQVNYFPNTDLTNAKINSEVDLIFSRHALEHIPPKTIEKIHINITSQINNHIVLHYISPSDHRSFFDKNLLRHSFLKYNEIEWKKRHTRFDYHNRMIISEYRNLFLELGYEILYEEIGDISTTYKDISDLKKIKLNERFIDSPIEETAAESYTILLEYKR